MPPRIARFQQFINGLSLGAIYALIAIASLPRSTGGIDGTLAAVTWISVGFAVLGLIGVHVLIARGLLAIARGERRAV